MSSGRSKSRSPRISHDPEPPNAPAAAPPSAALAAVAGAAPVALEHILHLVAVQLSGGVISDLRAEIRQRVSDVKQCFGTKMRTPPRYFRLVLAGRELRDDLTLAEEGLAEHASEAGTVNVNIIRTPVEAPSLLAITEDDPLLVPFLIECEADPNETDEMGWTALHWSAHHRHLAVSHAVVARPDFLAVNAQDIGRLTALHAFAQHGLPSMCQVLADRQDFTQLNARGPYGNTALHFAARNGHAEVCETILKLDGFTATNEQNMYGWTALHYAAAVGLCGVCRLILAHPHFLAAAEVTNNGETALHWAALNGREDVCKLLLQDGRIDATVPDVEGMLAVDGARTHGHHSICSLLVAH